mmetsp:Transcript_16239/g.38609  ORF Transcript_16239/g.38609 Transcript_16239/m.38609 type:complete len:246 (-) Transcript_16239:16-753(-)
MPWRYAKLGSGWGGKGGEASLVGLNLGAWLGGLLAGGWENLGGLLAGGGGLKPVASGASGLKAGAPTRNEGMSQMLSPSGVISGGVTRPAVAGAAVGGIAGGIAGGIVGGSSGLGSSSPCEAPPRSSPLGGGKRPGGGLKEDDALVLQPPMRAGSAEGAPQRPAAELAERDLCSWERGLVNDSAASCCCGCCCCRRSRLSSAVDDLDDQLSLIWRAELPREKACILMSAFICFSLSEARVFFGAL